MSLPWIAREADRGEGATMRVRYDGAEVAGPLERLSGDADALRELGVAVGQVADGLADPHVIAGLTAVTEACRRALGIVATDLELAGSRIRAGAWVYDELERVIAGAAAVPGRR